LHSGKLSLQPTVNRLAAAKELDLLNDLNSAFSSSSAANIEGHQSVVNLVKKRGQSLSTAASNHSKRAGSRGQIGQYPSGAASSHSTKSTANTKSVPTPVQYYPPPP
jgi:hypothetical protein